MTVIANSYQGRQPDRPNDVVVKSDGCIYFTDSWSLATAAPNQWDLSFNGVYRVTPDLGTLTLLADDFLIPNGLAFSPDESVLYINDTSAVTFGLSTCCPNALAKQSDRVFADLRGPQSGVPDGMKVDVAGNVFCGGAGGIYILDPQGKKLGRIVHGAPDDHGVRGRRLENPVLHHPHPARHGQSENSGRPGAGGQEIGNLVQRRP